MSGAPLLEVHGLKRSFGDREIIHGISFTVHASDILFVRGASGVGKSLLLRALAYLDPIQVHIVLAPYSSSYRARPARSATEETPGCTGLLAATQCHACSCESLSSLHQFLLAPAGRHAAAKRRHPGAAGRAQVADAGARCRGRAPALRAPACERSAGSDRNRAGCRSRTCPRRACSPRARRLSSTLQHRRAPAPRSPAPHAPT